jgi:hypothetical protein
MQIREVSMKNSIRMQSTIYKEEAIVQVTIHYPNWKYEVSIPKTICSSLCNVQYSLLNHFDLKKIIM